MRDEKNERSRKVRKEKDEEKKRRDELDLGMYWEGVVMLELQHFPQSFEHESKMNLSFGTLTRKKIQKQKKN